MARRHQLVCTGGPRHLLRRDMLRSVISQSMNVFADDKIVLNFDRFHTMHG